MVDFARLRDRTPEQREADHAALQQDFEAEQIRADLEDRRRLLHRLLPVTLEEAPRRMISTIGEVFYRIYGSDRRQKRVVASYKKPYGMDTGAFDEIMAAYTAGSVIELAGSFQSVSWYTGRDRHCRQEFFAAYIGDEGRQAIANGQASGC
jgi:hypothetical protein